MHNGRWPEIENCHFLALAETFCCFLGGSLEGPATTDGSCTESVVTMSCPSKRQDTKGQMSLNKYFFRSAVYPSGTLRAGKMSLLKGSFSVFLEGWKWFVQSHYSQNKNCTILDEFKMLIF